MIVSPEDAAELDLTVFVRRLMATVERDLGRKLEWAAVNHYDTEHPHAHVVIRGVDRDGRELRLDRAYISNGIRSPGIESRESVEIAGNREDSRTDTLREIAPSVRNLVASGPRNSTVAERDIGESSFIETTLVRALGEAAAAGRFDVVAQLAKELEARRLDAAGVPSLTERRRGP